MSIYYIEQCIAKHKTNRTYDGIQRLMSLNVDGGSMVIDKNTIIYEDKNHKNSIFYEVPFYEGDPTKRYHIKWAWAFIKKNKNKKVKLLTVGSNPKLEYVTIESKIHEKNEKKYIKLNKFNKFNNSKGSQLSIMDFFGRRSYD